MPGAPIGNKNAAKPNRLWGDAIRRAIAQNDSEKLRKAADALVKAAENGDVAALRELGDRLDGKAPQQITVSGDADEPLRIVHESK